MTPTIIPSPSTSQFQNRSAHTSLLLLESKLVPVHLHAIPQSHPQVGLLLRRHSLPSLLNVRQSRVRDSVCLASLLELCYGGAGRDPGGGRERGAEKSWGAVHGVGRGTRRSNGWCDIFMRLCCPLSMGCRQIVRAMGRCRRVSRAACKTSTGRASKFGLMRQESPPGLFRSNAPTSRSGQPNRGFRIWPGPHLRTSLHSSAFTHHCQKRLHCFLFRHHDTRRVCFVSLSIARHTPTVFTSIVTGHATCIARTGRCSLSRKCRLQGELEGWVLLASPASPFRRVELSLYRLPKSRVP